MIRTIPEDLRTRFKSEKVFVRGIADSERMEVLFTHEKTIIPAYAFQPMAAEELLTDTKGLTFAELQNSAPNTLLLRMRKKAVSQDKISVRFVCPDRVLKDHTLRWDYPFQYRVDGSGPYIRLELKQAVKLATDAGTQPTDKVQFSADYVPDLRS